jgi:hypothetical protein
MERLSLFSDQQKSRISEMHIGQTAPTDKPARDALPSELKAVIWKRLVEAGQHRPLTRQEIRLRCICQPRPWRDLGIDRSTWFRRRKRALLAAQTAVAA